MGRRVAVVGAGWSGLACALELTAGGHAVALFEAAPQAGGRARAVRVRLGDRDFMLDNGQHLLIGGYVETLRLMGGVGVDAGDSFLRLPFELRYPDGLLLRTPRLPPPLDLLGGVLGAGKLAWADRLQVLGFALRWRTRGWKIAADVSADRLFDGAPGAIVRRLWRPLCLSALNVELERASAQVLLNVLRDSLAGDARAADLLIPRRDLTQAFAGPALDALRERGADVHLRCPVRRLSRVGLRWLVEGRGASESVDALVLALPPRRAADLLATTQRDDLAPAIDMLRAIEMAPIVTVYLRYAPAVQLAWAACALLDEPSSGRFGQWVFDRGRIDPENAGVLGVVISAADAALAIDRASLAKAVAEQLGVEFGLPAALASAVLAEKRATIVPSPGLKRPPARLAAPALYLAGDAAASDYPSTLEGSVRAGVAAARAIAADLAAGGLSS